MKIFIKKDHQNRLDSIIGVFEDGLVTLIEPMAKEGIEAIFGHIAYKVLEFGPVDEARKVFFIKKFQIISWVQTPR